MFHFAFIHVVGARPLDPLVLFARLPESAKLYARHVDILHDLELPLTSDLFLGPPYA